MARGPMDPFASAVDVAAAVRSGSLSATEVAEAALARIAEVDALLGAFTVVLGERALDAARAVDRHRSRDTELPLAGVPVAVKDHVWLAGVPATNGSRILADFIPTEDCVAVQRLTRAGAVVVGKTNNPEFCYRGDTDSPLWGLTRNPFDLERTPGGSSGGSGVAVATGMAALAVGTDGGGSIRGPSAFCGTVGHKPTYGIVPTRPGFRGWPTLSVHGPMGRSVSDVAGMLAVMAGPHSADPAIVPFDTAALASVGAGSDDLAGLRVAVSADFGFATVERGVLAAFDEALKVLEGLGCELTEAHPPPQEDAVALWQLIAACEGYASEGPLLGREAEMTRYSARTIRAGEGVAAREYLDAQWHREALSRAWGAFFEDYDVIVSPGQQVLPYSVMASDEAEDESTWGMDSIANLTGQPVTSVPSGLAPGGLPVGVQFMGRQFADAQVLTTAAVFERHVGRPVPQAPFGPVDEHSSSMHSN
jgi:Asp-tRNA(Asn)/Glu-tRNA(Gln) amidotransferase A subunit family amidase